MAQRSQQKIEKIDAYESYEVETITVPYDDNGKLGVALAGQYHYHYHHHYHYPHLSITVPVQCSWHQATIPVKKTHARGITKQNVAFDCTLTEGWALLACTGPDEDAVKDGVYVAGIRPGAPAALVLRVGMKVIKINGRDVAKASRPACSKLVQTSGEGEWLRTSFALFSGLFILCSILWLVYPLLYPLACLSFALSSGLFTLCSILWLVYPLLYPLVCLSFALSSGLFILCSILWPVYSLAYCPCFIYFVGLPPRGCMRDLCRSC